MTDGCDPGESHPGDPSEGAGASTDASTKASSTLAAITGKAGGAARMVLGPLVGSKLRIALLVVVGLVGLGAAGFFLGVLGAPEVTGVQSSFGNVTQNETVVETNVTVSNPNPVGVSLGGVTIDYDVGMNDVHMANGTKEGVSIDSGNSATRLETTMFNDRIPPWWASHVENGERTDVTIDSTVASSSLGQSRTFTQRREIQTDILGQFASDEDREISSDQALHDPMLIVRETDASWDAVSRNETPLNMDFTVHNPNPGAYAISELRYEVTMNDVLVCEGATEEPFWILSGQTKTLETTTNIQNQRLDEWWISHQNDSVHGH